MLSTVESRYAILKGLLAEVEVSTKDSEKLWFTSRVSNTISDLRNVYGFRIVTISKKTATGKRYGVYALAYPHDRKDIERICGLLDEFKKELLAKYGSKPELLRLYLEDGYDDEEPKAS